MFTAIVTPYRIAFYETDALEWQIIDYLIDILFGFDIVLNFFTAYYKDNDDVTLIDDLKVRLVNVTHVDDPLCLP